MRSPLIAKSSTRTVAGCMGIVLLAAVFAGGCADSSGSTPTAGSAVPAAAYRIGLPPTTQSGAPVPTESAEVANPQLPPLGFDSFLIKEAPALPSDLASRQMNAEADGDNWLLYGRTYKSQRYSPLTQINKDNVNSLKLAWSLDTGLHNAFEASPIVVDGVMYFSTPWNNVLAVDAVTGKPFWRYAHKLQGTHPILCCDAPNRGVGIGAGKVVMATLDARLVALDSRTGKLVWDTRLADVGLGYSATLAPQVIGNKVIVGISGGEYGVRGFIDCYDINTGKQIWRWYTIPGPGEPGHDTWQGDSWKTGGCPNWMTCSYDPAMNAIFCGIGNAGPDINGDQRAGLNLYATCVVSLDLNTGKLKWYYQTVPHDVWDLDCTTSPIIDDLSIDGQQRKVVMFSAKNGYFYTLDRTNGKPVYALKVAHLVNWGTVSPDGVPKADPRLIPTKDGTVVAPGNMGGKEWANEAYDPERKLCFIPLTEMPVKHTKVDQQFIAGEFYWGGFSEPQSSYGHVTAVDVTGKKVQWETRTSLPLICSITCTASGLVITGGHDRKMMILDSDSGKELYTFYGTSGWHGNPVVYAVNGKEYICFPNGWGGPPTGAAQASGIPTDNTVYVFTLP